MGNLQRRETILLKLLVIPCDDLKLGPTLFGHSTEFLEESSTACVGEVSFQSWRSIFLSTARPVPEGIDNISSVRGSVPCR